MSPATEPALLVQLLITPLTSISLKSVQESVFNRLNPDLTLVSVGWERGWRALVTARLALASHGQAFTFTLLRSLPKKLLKSCTEALAQHIGPLLRCVAW